MNTPITNDAAWEDGRGHFVVGVDLARQLERDRARLLEIANHIFANSSDFEARRAVERVFASLEIKDDK